MGCVMFRNDHETRGAPVESVHDTGALFSTDATEPGYVMEQCVHEGAMLVARCRVNDHTRGLIVND